MLSTYIKPLYVDNRLQNILSLIKLLKKKTFMKPESYTKTLLLILLILPSLLFSQDFTSVSIGDIVTTPSGSRSSNFIDINNDNYEDIFISNGTSGGENNMMYLNNGDGTFTLIDNVINEDNTPSDGATCADYDNDGSIDVFVVNWYNDDNLLYLNDNIGGFSQIDTGFISTGGGYSETASWGDADQDGYVDLYVTNSGGNKKNFLFKNHGNGYFERILGQDIVNDAYYSRCVNWIDYDNDGDEDVFVTNENNQANNLYRNDGDFVFTKIETGILVTDLKSSMSASWADFDNDGDFDVFVANYQQNNKLYINDGEGNFSYSSGPWNSDIGCSFSSSFSDYDNDGDLDLFVTNGYCSDDLVNYLYENNGDASFTKIEEGVIATDVGGSFGCAWGDYNNDGQLDLVVANWQDETQTNSLYKNDGNENHWLKVKLHGEESNLSAIGTYVKVKVNLNGVETWQTKQVSGQSGYCSQNSLVVHFGLGDALLIDSLIIKWPSGIEQIFTDLESSTYYSVVEDEEVETVGINLYKRDNSSLFNVFPNPTHSEIILNYKGNDRNAQLFIYTIGGKLIHQTLIESGQNKIELSKYEGSVFIFKLVDDDGIYSQQVIKM